MPRQFGPSNRAPCDADESEEIALSRLTFRADLREAGGDHADRSHAYVERCPHRLRDCARGDADDHEVDLVGDVADGAVPADARNGLRLAVDGVRGARVLAGKDVAEELSADRPSAGGRAQHGDAARFEERTEGRDDGTVIAFLHP